MSNDGTPPLPPIPTSGEGDPNAQPFGAPSASQGFPQQGFPPHSGQQAQGGQPWGILRRVRRPPR